MDLIPKDIPTLNIGLRVDIQLFFLHVSGVVTTLFAAILLVKTHKDIFEEVRQAFHKYWDYTGFITNSFFFFDRTSISL